MALYGDVTFTLAGQQYTVRYGNLAWDAIYRALKVTDATAVIARLLNGDPEARDVLLREGLATYHPEITKEQARVLYDQIAVEGERTLWQATWEALSMALPKMAAALEGAARTGAVPARETPPTSGRRPRRSGKRR